MILPNIDSRDPAAVAFALRLLDEKLSELYGIHGTANFRSTPTSQSDAIENTELTRLEQIISGYVAFTDISTSAKLAALVSDETGGGELVFADSPIFSNITIGKGAAGIDYSISFNGETNDGALFWMEDEAVLNLRTGGATYFDYPGETSAFTINDLVAGGLFRPAFAAWSQVGSAGNSQYGFFGGVYDTGAAGYSVPLAVGAAAYNYLTGSGVRTVTSLIALQAYNDIGAATNLTVTEAIGIEISPGTGQKCQGISILGTVATGAYAYGLRIGACSGATVNLGISSQADWQLCRTGAAATASRKLYFGGLGGTGAPTLGDVWLYRNAVAAGASSALLLGANGADRYQFAQTAFFPVTNGAIGLGQNGNGWLDLWFLDTSAAFEDRIVFTSSTALTADRTLTVDMVNVSSTLKISANSVLNQDVSTGGSPVFVTVGASGDSGGVAGRLNIPNAVAAVSGATPATLGNTGGGPTGAAQSHWLKVYDGVTARFIPVFT